jgi:uncharacterized protein (TIGR03067 family)
MSKDLDKLQGAWAIGAMEMDGEAMAPEAFVEARVVVKGDRFTSTGMGAVYEGTLVLDSSASPARIDMKFDAGPEKGNTNPGIYQIDGDSWKLCLATRGSVRPEIFQSPAGSGIAVQTMVRGAAPEARKGKAKVASEPAAGGGPATELEGQWPMVSAVMSGKPMEASMVGWVKRTTTGNLTTVMAGPQTMLKAEFTLDPAQSPKGIDYLNVAGSHKGKRQLGIYKLEGDVLTFCVAPPGAARPGEFSSVKGDDRTLTVWRRG